ncbi:MAG: Gfo/Idh/MocA family oxidoreductase [Lentisphaerae bacterium]|jgi:predicted dehydrogenase|nr:Gfo/Idh/MocA family oxidoreductase [Lentisphaerota bacterium]MBT4822186.1 Gfo/Idh/MocA family oxidoreductase [Lentisphaerota bacterium]MBT5610376.1 Gfo/Idh/MocA family oxidoreductase [Lentisphaerota bacterium]MBT7056204.1 Gfo/Idh/MocA family oxidoreductase [Lentisphaerota bacterium]MBT7841874.1 Gfo/Idh/MocA family oxidoreductase [Lentisphaerota bacterium]
MLRMGIIGAENSHCAAIARLLNVEQALPCRVVSVWGEAPRFARQSAEVGQIPEIVADWRAMLGKVDGVMITHRHAKYHAEVARFFVRNGVPCFVDKPFTFTLREGKSLCRLSRKHGVPIISFSVRVLHKTFRDFREAVKGVGDVAFLNSTGPADLKSKYGGVFFYGIHQVDPVIELFGNQVDTAFIRPHRAGGIATLTYKRGPVVTINCVNNGFRGFHSTVVGDGGLVDWTFGRDASPHIVGARLFVDMFRTGEEPIPHERMLAPIAVLEALAESLETGRTVKVARVALS